MSIYIGNRITHGATCLYICATSFINNTYTRLYVDCRVCISVTF